MLTFNWKKKSFGLDISETVFRVVQLKKSGNKIRLISYNSVEVPKNVFHDGKIVEIDKAVSLLKQLIHEVKGKKIATQYVTACLAENKTFIKLINLEISSKNKEEILKQIIEESKKHIPYALEDVYFDWQYTNASENILIGACPKEVVENYQETISKAGFIPVALEIEAVAIARSLFNPKLKMESPVMILDLGANRTGLIVYLNNTIPFTLSINFSGDLLTKTISEKLRISPEQAEQAKRYCGLDKTKAQGIIYEIIDQEFKLLSQKIREAKYFFHEHFHGLPDMTELYLIGGGSHIPGLIDFLSQETNLTVKTGNPLINIYEQTLILPKNEISSYATVIGLALRNYFLPN
jgi:type IV pilus assembly protein PilM